MTKKKVESCFEQWIAFKKARKADVYFSDQDERFLTMLDRERLIDFLFKRLGLHEKRT